MEKNEEVFVADHALLNYIKRHKPDIANKVITEIKTAVRTGSEVYPVNNTIKLMNNGYKPRRYVKKKQAVFVISNDNTVVTSLDYNKQSFKVQNK